MEALQLDTGVKSYPLGRGELRFNPTDPNVYARFLEAGERLEGICKAAQGEDMLSSLAQADRKIKEEFRWVFGPENDFETLLEGVSLFAMGENGKRVLENLMDALTPILDDGARLCAQKMLEEREE